MIKGDEGQVPAPLHTWETQTSSSCIFPGFYNSGDVPGPVTPNPRERGLGQATLCHLPKCASQDRGVWGQLCLTRLDCFHHGVYPEVCSLCRISVFWDLPCSAGRQLSLTVVLTLGCQLEPFLGRTVCGASQAFESFHVDQLILLL